MTLSPAHITDVHETPLPGRTTGILRALERQPLETRRLAEVMAEPTWAIRPLLTRLLAAELVDVVQGPAGVHTWELTPRGQLLVTPLPPDPDQ